MMKTDRPTSRERRIYRVRRKIIGAGNLPRLSVYRSNRYIYAQIIDDRRRKTLVAASCKEIKGEKETKISKCEMANLVGKLLGEKAVKMKLKRIVFDRGRYKYHGKIKALAEGAREAGLNF